MTLRLGNAWGRERMGSGRAENTAMPRLLSLFGNAWQWMVARRVAQTRAGRLRVAESVSLGEKRFVAVIELDGRQFLIGGAATSVSLLARLGPKESEAPVGAFSDLLQQTCEREEN